MEISTSQIRSSRALLTCGIVAGPLYIVVALIQMLIRDGFDITRHSLSLLSNGELGWIQIANFLLTGALVVAAAVGIKRTLQSGVGRAWAPRTLALFGISLIGGGVFSADPALGFPPGTPASNTPISWHGWLHFIIGTIGFIGFIACCLIFARRFATLGQRGWSSYSAVSGVLFFAAFVGIASGSKGPFSLTFAIAVGLAFLWISMLLARIRVNSAA